MAASPPPGRLDESSRAHAGQTTDALGDLLWCRRTERQARRARPTLGVEEEGASRHERHARFLGRGEQLPGIDALRETEPQEIAALGSGPGRLRKLPHARRRQPIAPGAQEATHTCDARLEESAAQELEDDGLRGE